MLAVMNHVLTTAPTYDATGMVGFPINAILDFPMITPAGLAAFADPKVNAMFRKYWPCGPSSSTARIPATC